MMDVHTDCALASMQKLKGRGWWAWLVSRINEEQAMSIGDAVDDVTGLKLASSTQTTLHDYFQ